MLVVDYLFQSHPSTRAMMKEMVELILSTQVYTLDQQYHLMLTHRTGNNNGGGMLSCEKYTNCFVGFGWR